MQHAELLGLIRAGIPAAPGSVWADFGAGSGSFTRALRELVGTAVTLYAIDHDARHAAAHNAPNTHFLAADFTQPLKLPPLDGALVANALHWTADPLLAVQRIATLLKPGGVLLVVEYAVETRLPYVPIPLPFPRLRELFAAAGLTGARQIGWRTSPRTGVSMVAAAAEKPAAASPTT